MEETLRKVSKILGWVGWLFLGTMIMAMLVFGFAGAMASVAVLAVANGGDPSPIFLIVKGVNFLVQFSMIMFFFAVLLWAFAEISKSNHLKRAKWEQRRREAIVEVKEAVLDELKKSRRRR